MISKFKIKFKIKYINKFTLKFLLYLFIIIFNLTTISKNLQAKNQKINKLIYDDSLKDVINKIVANIDMNRIISFYSELFDNKKIENDINNIYFCFMNSDMKVNDFLDISNEIIKKLNLSYEPSFIAKLFSFANPMLEGGFVFSKEYNIKNIVIIFYYENKESNLYEPIIVHELFHLFSIYNRKEYLLRNIKNNNELLNSSILNEAFAYFTNFYYMLNIKIENMDIIKNTKETVKKLKESFDITCSMGMVFLDNNHLNRNFKDKKSFYNQLKNSYKYKYIYDIKSVMILNYFFLYLIDKYGINKFLSFYRKYVYKFNENILIDIYNKSLNNLLDEYFEYIKKNDY